MSDPLPLSDVALAPAAAAPPETGGTAETAGERTQIPLKVAKRPLRTD